MTPFRPESVRVAPSSERRPRTVRVDPTHPDESIVDEAARLLAAGGLVAFPTETVYGLGARALDAVALGRLFAAKQRPRHHPIIAHVGSEAEAATLAAHWPDAASRLARAFWPGPLTLVVDRAAHVDPAMSGGGTSIAVRVPAHPIALALVRALGEPIAAPSANRFQGLSPTAAVHVVDQLGTAVDLVLDGGACDAGIESTVVDVRGVDRGEPARILRPGALAPDRLRRILPDVARTAGPTARDAVRASPGMDDRHYAPRARVTLCETAAKARALARVGRERGQRVGVVIWTKGRVSTAVATGSTDALPDSARHGPGNGAAAIQVASAGWVIERTLPADPAGYARLLYAALHELDAAGATAIVVECVPDGEAWWAVADRLVRASSASSEPQAIGDDGVRTPT